MGSAKRSGRLSRAFSDSRLDQSFRLAIWLGFGIGILNSCTYMTRGHVFASSQSGNLLYLGMNFAQGEFSSLGKYMFPVFTYGLGIFMAEHLHQKYFKRGWRKISTVIEIVLIVFATFLPLSWNALANPVFGFVVGMQCIVFKKFHQISLGTVFINGNVRNAIEYLTRYFHIKDPEALVRGIMYIFMVIFHLLGIITGALLVPYWGQYTGLLAAGILAVSLVFLILVPEKLDINTSDIPSNR